MVPMTKFGVAIALNLVFILSIFTLGAFAQNTVPTGLERSSYISNIAHQSDQDPTPTAIQTSSAEERTAETLHVIRIRCYRIHNWLTTRDPQHEKECWTCQR